MAMIICLLKFGLILKKENGRHRLMKISSRNLQNASVNDKML